MLNQIDKRSKAVISRQDAIKRMGLITLSGATMMLLLNQPTKGQDSEGSPDLPPEWTNVKQKNNVAATFQKAS